jgi:uncharacterized protein YeeX (DUF496 family)
MKERTSFNRMCIIITYILLILLYVKIKRKSNRISKGLPIDVKRIRFIHRYDEYLQPGFSSIEFKILDSKLLDVIKNHKGDFIVDRYIIEWKTKSTF